MEESVLSDIQLNYYNRNNNNEQRNRFVIENSFCYQYVETPECISDYFHSKAIIIH